MHWGFQVGLLVIIARIALYVSYLAKEKHPFLMDSPLLVAEGVLISQVVVSLRTTEPHFSALQYATASYPAIRANLE
jgi:hypothetical protein